MGQKLRALSAAIAFGSSGPTQSGTRRGMAEPDRSHTSGWCRSDRTGEVLVALRPAANGQVWRPRGAARPSAPAASPPRPPRREGHGAREQAAPTDDDPVGVVGVPLVADVVEPAQVSTVAAVASSRPSSACRRRRCSALSSPLRPCTRQKRSPASRSTDGVSARRHQRASPRPRPAERGTGAEIGGDGRVPAQMLVTTCVKVRA